MREASACVHAGTWPDTVTLGANSPIYPSTATGYLDRSALTYPRYFNTPNQTAVAEKIRVLEKGEEGLVFSSGMAAISSTFFALLVRGDHVVLQRDLYGGTHQLVLRDFERFGIGYSMVDAGDPDNFEKAVQPSTRMIYVETPSNPTLAITDLRAVADVARRKGLITAVDNTFASPVNQNPIELGLDVVLHSGTKYLGGHSDLCCGAAVTSRELAGRIREYATHAGGSLDSHSCYLLERSLKTLAIRVARQNENALQVAQFLSRHANVQRVYYPGLESHSGHAVAQSQMKGFGGMVAFEVRGDASHAEQVQRRLTMIRPAVSLGGVDSVICSPVKTSHKRLTPPERASMGLSDSLLRLSVGIEDARDLIDDLTQALSSLA